MNDLVHEDYHELLSEAGQVTQPEDSLLLELGFLCSDGSTTYGEARWSPIVFNDRDSTLVIIRDQSQSRRAADAVRKSEKEFKYLAEWNPDPIVVSVGGKFVYTNQAAQRVTGYSFGELYMMPVDEMLHTDDLGKLANRRAQIENGIVPVAEEMRITRKDGTILITELNSYRGSFSGDENARIVHLHDLTSKRAAENELRLQEDKLRQSQKMEAIGTLAGGIAHDFNNMLSVIIGFSELAQSEVDEKSKAHRYLNSVLLASQQATDLVRQILTFSRRDREQKTSMDLDSCVRSALVLLKQSIPTSIELRSQFNTRTSTVFADETQLQQIIINLHTNAAYAIGKIPGIIELILDDFEVKGKSHAALADGKYLRLTIRDNGRGMTKDVLEHAFDPFYTTKEVGEGTGLGLSMVYSIIEGHDAVIEVASDVATGTDFTMYFPRTLPRFDEKTIGIQSNDTGKERILVVDDDEMVLKMLEETLIKINGVGVSRAMRIGVINHIFRRTVNYSNR